MMDRKDQKSIGFLRLTLEALPELWSCRFVVQMIIAVLTFLFTKAAAFLIHTRGAAVTSANMKSMLISWQGVLLMLVTAGFACISVAVELFLQVQFCGDILQNKRAGIFDNLKKCIVNLRKFWNPGGISILLYVLMGVPLAGIGFSVELTKDFKLPNFIMEVIYKRPVFFILFFGGTLLLLVLGFFYIFSVHGVLISGKRPKEAKKYSIRLIKHNWLKFSLMMLLVFAVTYGLRLGGGYLLHLTLDYERELVEKEMPEDYRVLEEGELFPSTVTAQDLEVIRNRIGYITSVVLETALEFFLLILARSFTLFFFTKLYMDFDRKEQGQEKGVYYERPKGRFYIGKIVLMAAFFVLTLLFSIFLGIIYDLVMEKRDIEIIAHRSCGDLGFENSLEGLTVAMEHGAGGGEIDIQRTLDGEYIIFHDTDFKRLAGVKKKPGEMTLREIQSLRLMDENGNAHSVPMLRDFLKKAKKEGAFLLLELKGETADEQMVDDVVEMVREEDCMDNVMLISLKYQVIQYAETTYPEFDTSALFFWGVGNFQDMDCDVIGLEELLVNDALCFTIHQKGKQVSAWTPNTEESLRTLLDSDLDMITTDSVDLAERIKEELNERSPREVLKDRLEFFLGG